MGWVRLDDLFPDHPKVIGLSDEAFRVFVTSLCYCNRYLTDGLIPQLAAERFTRNIVDVAKELTDCSLWERDLDGWRIRSYTEYQPTKDKVERKREQTKERVTKARAAKQTVTPLQQRFNPVRNALETIAPTHTQPNPNTTTDVVVSDEPFTNIVRNKAAKEAVYEIHLKLAEARRNGINAWNLSRLVEEQWDALHAADEIGGCIALTVWYVAELQSRQLTSAEIGRIGQMTKRFGRIALLAIDEAASKDLDDLVSYAFRVAQRMYQERKVS